jgi:pyrimidine deaminase RibD-like protein
MILNDFTAPRERFGREKLDAVLAELCGMVEQAQQENPDFYGMVAAAVLDPTGKLATGVNYVYGNGRVHAERAAIDNYEEEYGELPKGSIVITTLSPCSQDTHDNRHGESCTDFLNSKRIKMAYCGYKDPTQEDRSKFTVIITQDAGIEELCKQFADTFLSENFADGKKPGRKGLAKRSGVNTKASVSSLRKTAKNSTGEKQRMAHWMANMKAGKKKKANEETSKQILSYVKKIHPKGEFTIDQSITDHPEWELTRVPLSSLHIESNEVSPYDQITHINYDHVAKITAQDIKNKPIVVDSNGWIIDGNHRAVAAKNMGLTEIPAYVPVESEEDDGEETYAQFQARLKREREQGIREVINHPGIKTKTQDTSGLVNKGEPVPAGKEQRLLGNLVGKLGAYEVYKWDKGNDSAYSVFDPNTRVSQMTISGTNKAHSFEIFGIYGGPKAPVRAADLYAWLVKNQGLTLVSDKYQSPGGQRVWQELEQRYGRSVNVYAYNMRTNQPINTGADDPESTKGASIRLVAAPK